MTAFRPQRNHFLGLVVLPVTTSTVVWRLDRQVVRGAAGMAAPHGATALFAAGRHRASFFSLAGRRYTARSFKTAVDTCRGKVPIIAGAGGPNAPSIA